MKKASGGQRTYFGFPEKRSYMDLLSVSYLVLIIFGSSVQNVLKKLYLNKEKGGGVFVFSAFTVL